MAVAPKVPESRATPFVTSIERLARREGMCEGIESVLRIRFGEEGVKLMPEIQQVYEEEKLRAILKTLETTNNLDEVRRLWSPVAS